MTWNVLSTQNEDAWLSDYIADVIAHEPPSLPSHDLRIGHVEVSWYQVEPGIVHVASNPDTGTIPDRRFAESVVYTQLANSGFKQASVALRWDHSDLQKHAQWADLEDKARRLIQSGQVQLLRNSPDTIVGQVQGDHGNYKTEIRRQDPNGQSITGSHCDCDWGQFQNLPRTREWRRFQNRPCWLPGSLVNLADGTRIPIEDVQPGTQVLSAHGVQEVYHVWENEYEGDMQSIHWMGNSFGTTVTADHKMITHPNAADVWRHASDNGERSRQVAKALRDGDGWQQTLAHELQADDWLKLAYPTAVQEFLVQPGDFAQVLRQKEDRVAERNHMNTAPLVLTDSDAVLTIIGYYLAEGSIENRGKIITWTFAAHELHYVNALDHALQSLGAGELKRYPGHNRITVKVSNTLLARVLVYLCGDGARDKHLAPELMLLDPDRQRFLLERYAEGDGTGSDFSSTFFVHTASKTLAQQLIAVGARVYATIPALHWYHNSGGPTNRNAEDLWIAKIRMNQKFNNGVVRLGPGYYAARVMEVTSTPYQGKVYNLTVPPFHTVCVDDICSYQCSHVLATWWQAMALQASEQRRQDENPDQGQLFDMSPSAAPSSMGLMQRSPMPNPNAWFMQPGVGFNAPGAQMPQMGQPPPQAPSPADVLPQFPGEPQQMQLPPVNPASTPGGRPGPTPTDPIQFPGGTFSSIRLADQQYTNGQLVRLNQETVGTLVGRSEEHGAGGSTTIPAGSVGEVLGTDPTTQMVNVLFMGKQFNTNTFLEPFGASCWCWPSEITPSGNTPPGPAIRRTHIKS